MSTISVIIPTYNRAGYVADAIDSVLSQTRKPSEIIVVDDGSTDNTAERVSEYGDAVRYIRTANGGTAHARNVGTRESTGDYLAFLDSDDLFYPHMLEVEGAVLDRFPDVGFVFAEMAAFDDSGWFSPYYLKRYHSSSYLKADMTYERIFEDSLGLKEADLLPVHLSRADPALASRRAYFGRIFDTYLTDLVVFQNNLLMRRSLVGSVGLRNPAIKYWEEVDYILRMSRNHRACFLDLPTYKMRFHANQISGTSGETGRYTWIRKQQILLRVVKRHIFADREYYRKHRTHLDRHLARLHRAVAVPLLLSERLPGTSRDPARLARAYLSRCNQLGHRMWLLSALSLAPGGLRRFGVSVIEGTRQQWRSVRQLRGHVRTAQAGRWRAGCA